MDSQELEDFNKMMPTFSAGSTKSRMKYLESLTYFPMFIQSSDLNSNSTSPPGLKSTWAQLKCGTMLKNNSGRLWTSLGKLGKSILEMAPSMAQRSM